MRDPYDYSRYSLEQLLDAQAHVDRNLYAERAAEIDRWVQQRSAEGTVERKPRQSFVSPAALASGTQPVVVACGLAALLAAVCLGSIAVFLVIRARGEDVESKQVAIRVVTAVTRNWDPEPLRSNASREFKPVVSGPTIERAFKMFRQLGAVRSLGQPVGAARATAGIGSLQSGVTADYSFPAQFTNGEGTVRVTLVREDRQWRTTGFFVSSDAFLPK